jgi:predicted permease
VHDLRLALRLLRAAPWFATAVVVLLAFGIGLNTTVFTLVNAVLFKPLPFADGDRIVAVGSRLTADNQNIDASRPDFLDYRAAAASFEALEAADTGEITFSEAGRPAERYRFARTTAGFFDIVRTAPVLGRAFTPDDERPGAPLAAIVGYSVWQTRYAGSPDVLGRAVRVNEQPATIVGVMPEGFRFPYREDIWIPLRPGPADTRRTRNLQVVGLLKPGTTITEARTELALIARRLEAAHPDTNAGIGASVTTFAERSNGEVQGLFLLMLVAVGLVLLVACANVANLMLGRGLARQREMSVRLALGASRARLVRQLLVESLLFSAGGAVAGLGIAAAGLRAFDLATANAGKPSWVLFTFDGIVFAYVGALAVVSAVAFGLVPALRSSRVDLARMLKDGGRGGTNRGGRLSGALVVAQFTCSLVLVAGAMLMARSLVASQLINAAMPRQEIMTGRVVLPAARYPDREARIRFYEDGVRRLALVPGVTAAGVLSQVPGLGAEGRGIEVEDPPDGSTPGRGPSRLIVASPGYFQMFGLPILQGRAFDDRDGAPGRGVAVVTAEFARRAWPDMQPLGRRFRLIAGSATDRSWLTVIGVTGDFVQQPRSSRPDAVAFVPYRQDHATTSLVLAVRTRGDAAPFARPLRSVVSEIDPDLALYDVETFERALYDSRMFYRVFAGVFSIFGGAALLMAAVGLYAVMAQATARRTREIGIRMALGATPVRILTTVMRRGLVHVGIGLVLGVCLAVAGTRAMAFMLFGVTPYDPLAMGASALILVASGLVACWLPAWRATRLEAIEALGCEDP